MVSLKELQKFIQDLAKSDLVKLELKTEELDLKVQFKQEIDVELSGEKIALPAVATQLPVAGVYEQQAQQLNQAQSKKEQESNEKQDEKKDNLLQIKAPMVGTFYRRPAPDKPPFVEVGDSIKKGQVVCIIEAMKLFNEIESEFDGTIVEILVEDASPVEYDQPLFLIRPSK